MPKHAFIALALLLPLLITACESDASPFRDSPEDRLAASQAAEQTIAQTQSDAKPAEGDAEAAPSEPVPQASAEHPAGTEPTDNEGGTESVTEADLPLEPGSQLTTFLSLRFPQHEEFAVFLIGGVPDIPALRMVYSIGETPTSGHVAAILEVQDNRVIARASLTFSPGDGLVSPRIVQPFNPKNASWGEDNWFMRHGAVGAHGHGADLLRWNPNDAGPNALSIELSWSSALPGAAMQLIDYDADGVPEVRLDDTDAYVFCYACGVREVGFQVARWNGANLVIAPLARLAPGAPGPASSAVDFAIELAEANLWPDAIDAIDLAAHLAPDDPTIVWNAILIRAQAVERAAAAGEIYPLLTHLYAGQFGQAVASLRSSLPFDLLDLYGPITAGTPADGWETVVADTVIRSSDDALALRPDLAPALFLRGLARFWLAPDQADAAITDINAAAAIDPSEPLYEVVANLLTP